MKQSPETFSCNRCAYSCMQLVLLSDADIERIEKHTGLEEGEFVDVDDIGRKWLKMDGKYCSFLSWDRGVATCSIHEARPEVCRKYPFFEDGVAECDPYIRTENGDLVKGGGDEWRPPVKGVDNLRPYVREQPLRFRKR